MAELRKSLDKVLADFEKNIITEILEETSGNQTRAARLLGITKRKIQYKVCKYKIDWQSFRDRKARQPGWFLESGSNAIDIHPDSGN